MYPYAETSSIIVTISLTATEFLTSCWVAKHPAKICFKCCVFPSLPECSSSCSRSIGISIAYFRCRWWNSTPITWCSPDGGRRADTLTAVASDLMTQLTALRWIRRPSLNCVMFHQFWSSLAFRTCSNLYRPKNILVHPAKFRLYI